MKINFSQKAIYLLAVSLIVFSACGTPYQPEEDPDEDSQKEQEEQLEETESVPADGILEAVTWNLEWYGDGSSGNGPSDKQQQTENILQVTDSLKADLYAFQEVYSQEALHNLTENMEGYRGFVAKHIDWIQKTAFVFNTNAIDSVSSGAISDGQSSNAWAGRYPLFFKFDYNYEGNSYPIYAIVIHAKAFDDQESYQRRKNAAEDLYNYLMEEKPEAHIIFLGDYNDDLDESIYQNEETPYLPFVENDEYFEPITKVLSEEGKSSTVGYDDMIDHITMSNELYPFYMDGSAHVFQFDNEDDFIDDYGETTSDHYPVWAKFDLKTAKTVLSKN